MEKPTMECLMQLTNEERAEVKEYVNDMISGIVDKAMREEDLSIVMSFDEPYRSYRREQVAFLPEAFPEKLSEEEVHKLYMECIGELMQESLLDLLAILQGRSTTD